MRGDTTPTRAVPGTGATTRERHAARLALAGVVDARLEETAEGDGVIAKIAYVTHKVVDRLDND